MEHEPTYADEQIEDGELSADSDDVYTPLQRPALQPEIGACSSLTTALQKMDETLSEHEESLPEQDSSDSSESESVFQTKSKMAKLRIKSYSDMRRKTSAAVAQQQQQQQSQTTAKPKNYNIWSTGLQEESLLENLKGCGVVNQKAAGGGYDRSCESYDYSLKYRLNGENTLKRRKSSFSGIDNGDGGGDGDDYDNDDGNDSNYHKRFRASSFNIDRKNVRLRLGAQHRHHNSGDDDTIDDRHIDNKNKESMHAPRLILDLNVTHTCNDDVARDIANKLYEEKDDLLLKIVKILGRDLPMKIFTETKKIESEGGMLILNGQRRRTPGGVFLFLLKNCDTITKKQRTEIFYDEARKYTKSQKSAKAAKRDRKVEELKKSLKNENDLQTALSSRSELAHLNVESNTNLSNPPPSPVTDSNRENSSDFDTNDIQHVVNVTSPDKTMTMIRNNTSFVDDSRQKNIDNQQHNNGYEDDFLDVHCDDMDLF